MPTALIIGSGPATAGVALALTADPAHEVTVIDVGATLEPDLQSTLQRVSTTSERSWSTSDVDRIGLQPVSTPRGALPEKRSYGSDFPFRDVGQLGGIDPLGPANGSVVSGAYGGFSNVWGAQIMPFSRATFDGWPISMADMEPHYRVALGEMTLAGDDDDLAELFPLLVPARSLPPLAERTNRVLERYGTRRSLVQSHGITIGRARLAFKADECTRCGMCMTGCPYGLIYSSAHTFDRLRAENRITYRPGQLAVRLDEVEGQPHVLARDTATGRIERLSADRIFVACGGIGTTRLVLGSLGILDEAVYLQESVQFVLPAVSVRPVSDPLGPQFHPEPVQPRLRRDGGGCGSLPGPFLRLQPRFPRLASGCSPPATSRHDPCRTPAEGLSWARLPARVGVATGKGRGPSRRERGTPHCGGRARRGGQVAAHVA